MMMIKIGNDNEKIENNLNKEAIYFLQTAIVSSMWDCSFVQPTFEGQYQSVPIEWAFRGYETGSS